MPPKFLKVTNWDRYQHYKNRTPPWIKLYNSLLDDHAFCSLPDCTKAHFLCILLAASRQDNRIPIDGPWLSQFMHATEPIDLQLLVSVGLLAPCTRSASKMLAPCKQSATPERETERETEREEHRIERRDPLEADAPPAAMTFPVNGGAGVWTLTKTQVQEWAALYPGLDVIAECSKSLAWIRANNRKTAKGMPKFLVGWLNRANDSPKTKASTLVRDGAYRETKPRPQFDSEYSTLYAQARAEGKSVNEAAAFANSARDNA